MQFTTWEPIYRAILEDFGFSSALDKEAAKLLNELLRHREQSLFSAAAQLRGREVLVVGNAPTLKDELENLRECNRTLVAADGATAVLLEKGIVPEIVVTDLDGPFDAILEANKMGAIATVHAHGDNLDALKRCVPQLGMILGTVQCRPPQGLYNFGGFTDGDRCVFLAKELGAASITLLGFDFEDESVTPRKRKKLAWAKRLIEMALSENCSNQF
jgi:2-amino-4-hydroxy-6-hydroxymethyldihydropteridine diphosphokinase